MTVCFHLNLNYLDFSNIDELDRCYQNSLKKVFKSLYANPDLSIAFSIPGVVLEYISEKFPETVGLLKELVARSQVELLGGGYYAPVFPLLYPSDRSGQIEKTTSLHRNLVGKRPRGCSLFGSIWDSSLIPQIKSCGFEYVFLEDFCTDNHGFYEPLVVSEFGKSVKVLRYSTLFSPVTGDNFGNWKERVCKEFEQKSIDESFAACIDLNLDNVQVLIEKKFLTALLSAESGIKISTPIQYLKTNMMYRRSYIPCSMQKIGEQKKGFSTIYDFLNANPSALHLYERSIYINMLISQSHGKDRMRKKAAQEKLWEAQCGIFFINLDSGKVSSSKNRQKAYRLLNEAERYLHESGQFIEAMTSYDYDNDGFNEYIYQADNFNAVISPKGGRICDLNVLSNGYNYTDSFISKNCFAENTFFVETLTEKEPEKNSIFDDDLVFAQQIFSEKKFDGKRKEFLLESESSFSQLKMPVSLQKKIIASSTGFVIQYILKNLSPFQLKAFFTVSFNLCQTDFSNKNERQYELELIQDGNRMEITKDKCNLKNGVSMLQIVDRSGKMSFLFEPNEEAGFISEYEIPKNTDGEGCSQNLKFYWPIDLAAGRAMEKTVNFVLIPSRKNKENKK